MNTCKICLKKVSSDQKYDDYHTGCLIKLFDATSVSPILPFSREVFKTELSKNYTHGMSISGVQKKLSLKITGGTLALTSTGGTYILKPTVEDFPDLSENEHVSMLIGKALDIETPPVGLIKFSDGELVYIIKRFDWHGSKKIHKEDMASIFNLNRDEGETYKYSQSYESIGKKLLEVTGEKPTVILDFFNRLVYNYIIQNGDYHLKNISVIADHLSREGFYDRLSPNYDSVMTRLYFPEENELALDFLKDDELPKEYQTVGFYTRPDFEELGIKIGLTLPAVSVIFDKVKKRVEDLSDLVKASFLTESRKQQYLTNMQQRLAKLRII